MIDIIYTINQLFVEPLALLINLLMCNAYRNDGNNWIETEPYLDKLFMYFNMDTMDVKGYRRLRTISQLFFESMPQVILQIIFLKYAESHPDVE